MILVITPNTAIDRTLIIPNQFQVGQVSRATETIVAAGGKGLNVARAIHLFDSPVICAGLIGGHTGNHLAELATTEGLAAQWTEINADTRTCIIVINPNGLDATVFNEPGPTITTNDWDRLKTDVVQLAAEANMVCLCGSLPLGTLPDAPADLIQAIRESGKPIWVDTSKVALQVALKGKPTGIKVNATEAGDALDMTITNLEEAAQAALAIQKMGIANVVLTLGRDGAIMVSPEGRWWAKPPMVQAVSSVGSGDTFLAGLVTGFVNECTPANALARGVAAGTANTLSPGGGAFKITDFEAVLRETTLASL